MSKKQKVPIDIDSLNIPIFEVRGFQTMPDGLNELPDNAEVRLRLHGSESWVSDPRRCCPVAIQHTAKTARVLIQSVVDRQAKGCFELIEVAEILSDMSGENETFLRISAMDAFRDGKLRFFTPSGSPKPCRPGDVLPDGDTTLGDEWYLGLLGYNYTTPDEVNRWLEAWGARYRWPDVGANSGVANGRYVRTPKEIEEIKAYRDKHGITATTKHFNLSRSRVSQLTGKKRSVVINPNDVFNRGKASW